MTPLRISLRWVLLLERQRDVSYRVLRFDKSGNLRDIGWLTINAASMTFAVDDDEVRAALTNVSEDGYVHKWVNLSRGNIRADGIEPVAIGTPDFFSALEDRLKRLGVLLEDVPA